MKILYVETKEPGPLGGGRAPGTPPRSATGWLLILSESAILSCSFTGVRFLDGLYMLAYLYAHKILTLSVIHFDKKIFIEYDSLARDCILRNKLK